MAAKTAQELILDLKKQADSLITTSMVRRAAELVAKRSIEIIRERTASGVDITGKRFGGYNYSYQRFKSAFIKGTKATKSKKAKPLSKTMEKLKARATQYKATKVKDYLRLTGGLMSNLTFEITNVNVSNRVANARITLKVKKDYIPQATGLQSTVGKTKKGSYSKKAFRFFGLSTSGTNKQKEQQELIKIFQDTIKEQTKINFKTK